MWFERITEQLIGYREELSLYGLAMPPRPTNLPLHCSLTRPTSIVDLGGSSGWCWDHLRACGAGDTVRSYIVVETPEVVTYAQSAALQSKPVRYQTVEEHIEVSDTLYCNSVLQYFETNDQFISLVERTQPNFVLLDDLVAGVSKDFFTIQLFRGSAIPYRFLGLQSLLSDLSSVGYFVLGRQPYASPINGLVAPLPMEHFRRSEQLRYSSSLLLKREE